MSKMSGIFHIKPSVKFLETFSQGVLDRFPTDTFPISEIRILLPSKRACVDLKEIFKSKNVNVLPRIIAIGDLYDDKIKNYFLGQKNQPDDVGSIKPISAMQYRLLLASELRKREEKLDYSKALIIAAELQKLVSRFEKDSINLGKVRDINLGDIPEHAEDLMRHLTFMADDWIPSLRKNGKVSIGEKRNISIYEVLNKLQSGNFKYPIIVAGSNGSMKSVGDLIVGISRYHSGYVVLRGLDQKNLCYSNEFTEGFEDFKVFNGIDYFNHSFLLSELIDKIEVDIDAICDWYTTSHSECVANDMLGIHAETCNDSRSAFVSEFMCSIERSASWNNLSKDRFAQLSGVKYFECRDVHEEGLLIALKIKKLVESSSFKKIGVITYDKTLIDKIKLFTSVWGVELENSYGTSLHATGQVNIINAVINVMIKDFAPLELSALLKNKFCSLGYVRDELAKLASELEINYLRGVCGYTGLDGLYDLVLRDGSPELLQLIGNLKSYFSGLVKVFSCGKTSFGDFLSAIVETVDAISDENISSNFTDDEFTKSEDSVGADTSECPESQSKYSDASQVQQIQISTNQGMLWKGEIGEGVRRVIDDISNIFAPVRPIDFYEFKRLLNYALSNEDLYINYKDESGDLENNTTQEICEAKNVNVHILSAIEARLIDFDYVILAGLNEKSWPQNVSTTSWFHDGFIEDMNLSLPELQTGKAAQDFYCLMHNENICLTRSEIVSGSPQMPSRWLVRMQVVAEKIGKWDEIKISDHPILEEVRNFYLPKSFEKYKAPTPNPPVEYRPRKLSVTQVEKLIRDPYSVYANKILNLRKLDILDKPPDQLDFGNFLHDVLDKFNKKYDLLDDGDRLRSLISMGLELLKHLSNRPVVRSMWFPRFEKVARWIVGFEENCRSDRSIKIFTEIMGEIELSLGEAGVFSIISKADRLELGCNRKVSIIDFKSGSSPSKIDVQSCYSPQLVLEGVIAMNAGFAATALSVGDLIYIELSNANLGNIKSIKYDDNLFQEARDGVKRLLSSYMHTCTIDRPINLAPYLVCPDYKKRPLYNEYKHLERVDEIY